MAYSGQAGFPLQTVSMENVSLRLSSTRPMARRHPARPPVPVHLAQGSSPVWLLWVAWLGSGLRA